MSWLGRLEAGPRHDLLPLVDAPEVGDLPPSLRGARHTAKQAEWVRKISKLVRKQEGAA